MDLRFWLFENRRTIKSFADEIGYTPQYIGEYIHGRKRLSKRVALAIHKATKGKVTMEKILADNPPVKRRLD